MKILGFFLIFLIGIQARSEIFAPELVQARLNPQNAVTLLNREQMLLTKSWFEELQICYDALEKRGDHQTASKLATEFQDWTREPTRLIDLLHSKDLSRTLHPALPQVMFYTLETTYQKYAKACLQIKTPQIGTARFDSILQSILPIFDNIIAKNAILFLLNSSHGEKIVDGLLEWVPKKLLEQESFLSQNYIKLFVKQMLFQPTVRRYLIQIFEMNPEESKKLIRAVYEIVRPYQIHFQGFLDNNQTYPFIYYSSQKYFRDSQLNVCLEKINSKLAEIPTQRLTQAGIYAQLKLLFQSSCPDRSLNELRALLAIEDRMNNWVLPLTIKKSAGFGTASESKNYASLILTPRSEATTLRVFEQIKNFEAWTYWHKNNLMKKAFNHFSAPLYIHCELANSKAVATSKSAVIYLFGFFYQILDAEAKFRIFKIPTSEIMKDAIQDLNLWDEALKTSCS